MLKNILPGVVSVLVLLVGVSYLFPRYVEVSRAAQLASSSEALYSIVATPAEWPKWSPRSQRDPNMISSFSGPSSGQGARWDWESETQGDGAVVLIRAEPVKSIGYVLTTVGVDAPSYGDFRFTRNSSGTIVTWDLTTDVGNSPIGRWRGLMMPNRLSKDFDVGLRNLERYALSKR